MSETAQAAATEAAALDTSAQEAKAEPQKTLEPGDPSWLAPRLAQKERMLLKALGTDSVDAARELIEEARRLKAEKLSAEEKAQLRIAELEQATKEFDDYKKTVSAHAAEAMASLSPEQREVVEDLAGDSPAKQLRAITKLRPTWKNQDAPRPAVAPATTAPIASAPAAGGVDHNNHLVQWERLKQLNPIAAAYYLDQYQVEITEARKARK